MLVNYSAVPSYGHRPVLLINTSLSTLRSAYSPIWSRFPQTARSHGHGRGQYTHTHAVWITAVFAQVCLLRVSQWENVSFMSFKVITSFICTSHGNPCSVFALVWWPVWSKLVLRWITSETWRYIQMQHAPCKRGKYIPLCWNVVKENNNFLHLVPFYSDLWSVHDHDL